MKKITLATAIILASLSTQAMAFSLIGPLFQAGAKAVTNLAGTAVDKIRGSGDKQQLAADDRAKYEQQVLQQVKALPQDKQAQAYAQYMDQYDKIHNFVANAEAQKQAQRAQSTTVGGIAGGFVGDVAKGAIGQEAILNAAQASAKAGTGNSVSSSVVNAASVSGSEAAKAGTLAAALDKDNQDKVLHMIDKVANPGKSDAEIAATNAARLKEVQERGGLLSKIGYGIRHNTWDSFKSPQKPVEAIRVINPDSDKEMAELMKQPAQQQQPAQK